MSISVNSTLNFPTTGVKLGDRIALHWQTTGVSNIITLNAGAGNNMTQPNGVGEAASVTWTAGKLTSGGTCEQVVVYELANVSPNKRWRIVGTRPVFWWTPWADIDNTVTPARGNVIYRGASNLFSLLAPGTAGQVLTTQGAGADPSWNDSTVDSAPFLPSTASITTSTVTMSTNTYYTIDKTDAANITLRFPNAVTDGVIAGDLIYIRWNQISSTGTVTLDVIADAGTSNSFHQLINWDGDFNTTVTTQVLATADDTNWSGFGALYTAITVGGLLQWSRAGTPVKLGHFNDVNPSGGLGSTVGDRLTYTGTTYPFITQPWTNISVVSGAIAFEDFATPLSVTGSATPQLVDFVGALQPGAFLISTNGLGRLTNDDSFTWAFNINFSCSLTGANNTEWQIELFINGTKVSNPYVATVSAAGRYVSITGVWTQQLNGSSVIAVGPANQYCEIYITRNLGSGDVDIASAYLSCTAVKLQDRPA
jgi:hypothetical protein